MSSPPSPTIVFDIKYPDNPEAFSFQISIKIPNGAAPVIQASAPSLSIAPGESQMHDSERMEISLKQQLHQRKISQTDTVQSRPVLPGITTITPPRTSPSQSDKYPFELSEGSTSHRLALQVQSPLTDNCQHHDGFLRSNSSPTADLARRPAEAIDSLRTHDRPYRSIQPEMVPISSTHRSTSSPQTPPGSPRRVRSTSPVANCNISTRDNPERGRARTPRSIDNDNATSPRSRSSSRSRRSRSLSARSRSKSQDSRYSRSSSYHRDGMLVERLPSSRSRSPSPSARNTEKRTPKEDISEQRVESIPLKRRISDQYPYSPTKRSKHRICPFFHPTATHKHRLDEPHPGYTQAEFDEAVRMHENGWNLPPRLVKPGVGVNTQNKGSPTRLSAPSWIGRADASLTTARGVPTHRNSSSADDFRPEPLAKRRKIEPRERRESYRHDGGTLYPSSSYARAGGPMPQQGNYSTFQYPTAPRTLNDRPTRPRALNNSDPPRGMKPSYRRHPPTYPKYYA